MHTIGRESWVSDSIQMPSAPVSRMAAGILLLASLAACEVLDSPTMPGFGGEVRISPPATTSMFIGQQQLLTATVLEQNRTPTARVVTWTSSDPTVVQFSALGPSLDRATLTALEPGTVWIMATVEGRSDSLTITVRQPGPPVRITVPTSVGIMLGDSYTLTPVLGDSNGVKLVEKVSFASSDPDVAAVSADGLVTAIRAGTAAITVASASVSRVVEVRVKAWTHAFLWTPTDGMRDLGTLDGFTMSNASAVNAGGHVVGSATLRSLSPIDLFSHAFRWTATTGMVGLGVLVTGGSSVATAINRDGTVAGHATAPDGNWHAVIWTVNGAIRDLGTLPNELESYALGIDDAGRVFGFSGGDVFVWTEADGMKPLILPFSSAYITGVSALGDVFGIGRVEDNRPGPFVWSETLGTRALPLLPAAVAGEATAINARGDVLGWNAMSFCDGEICLVRAVLWPSGGAPVDLGASLADAYPTELNSSGQVVGWLDGRAFVWSATGGTRLLGVLPAHDVSWASAINDAGQVVGSSACAPCGTDVVP